MTIPEYEKKFTELVKYAVAFIMDEEDKYKRFEGGLRTTIQTPTTGSVDWSDFSKFVEATIQVERCLAEEEEKSLKEKKSISMASREEEKKSCEEISKWLKSSFS